MLVSPKILISALVLLLVLGLLWGWSQRQEPLLSTPTSDGSPAVPGKAGAAQPVASAKPLPVPTAAASGTVVATEDPLMDLLMREDPNPNYATFGERVQEVIARRNGQPVDPASLWAAMQQKNAWAPAEETPAQLPLTDEELSDGREFIQVNPLKIESLMPGDRMELPIAQANQTYTVVIDQVQSPDGENMTWSGHLEDFERDNQVVITRGDSLIVGGITTPDQLYALQVHGNQGWIATGATLFKGGDIEIPVPTEHQTDHSHHHHNPSGSTGEPPMQ